MQHESLYLQQIFGADQPYNDIISKELDGDSKSANEKTGQKKEEGRRGKKNEDVTDSQHSGNPQRW